VREVLDAYDVRGVEIELTEEGPGGALEMAFEARGPLAAIHSGPERPEQDDH
jgi:hypothetical protein